MNKKESPVTARDKEFVRVCLTLAQRSRVSGENATVYQIIHRAIHSQPCCHFVTYENAAKVLHGMEHRGTETTDGNRLHHLKWAELHSQVRDAMNGPRKLTFCKALSFVLAFRRPSRFYISPLHAMKLIKPYLYTHSIVKFRSPSC